MAKTNTCLKIDAELKADAKTLFDKLGMSLSDGVTIFLRQAVREQGLPFQPSLVSGVPVDFVDLDEEIFY